MTKRRVQNEDTCLWSGDGIMQRLCFDCIYDVLGLDGGFNMSMCDAMCSCEKCNPKLEGLKDTIRWLDSGLSKVEGDWVTSPKHYTMGIECWDYIASHHMNYNQGNMVKYATRYLLKDNPVQDLRKVIAYATKEIEILEDRGFRSGE